MEGIVSQLDSGFHRVLYLHRPLFTGSGVGQVTERTFENDVRDVTSLFVLFIATHGRLQNVPATFRMPAQCSTKLRVELGSCV